MSLTSDSPPPLATDFELEQVELYGKYMLRTPIEVLFILRTMVKRGCMATVYFDQGRSFFLTCLLAISSDEQNLILDIGSDQAVNRDAIQASRLIVTANLDSVKIQFVLTGLKEASFQGKPAFLAAVPETILRLQRREYFRLEIPLSEPLRCRIPIRTGEQTPQPLELPLHDISGGGLSLIVPTEMSDHFKPDILYPDCRLDIPHESTIAATLCVRSSFIVSPRGGGSEYLRAGCEFVNLPGTRLTVIQRYITRIERERKARLSGLD